MVTAFDLLQEAAIFTKLDLHNAYHLVCIREGDKWTMTFNTLTGRNEYQTMPFGLTNAPAIFQVLIKDVLRNLLNRFVFVFLYNILFCSKSMHKHVSHVSQGL